jgi:hypothetical protein
MAESKPKEKAVSGDVPASSVPRLSSFCSHMLSELGTSTLGGFCFNDLAEVTSRRALAGRSRSITTAGAGMLAALAGSFFFSAFSFGLLFSVFCFCAHEGKKNWHCVSFHGSRLCMRTYNTHMTHARGKGITGTLAGGCDGAFGGGACLSASARSACCSESGNAAMIASDLRCSVEYQWFLIELSVLRRGIRAREQG